MIKTPLSTVIGGAFWTPKATILGDTSKTFDQTIQSLFANGEQGFFYDPNDLSTMFQDAAGTVPVTGAGQPVGLILDKSGRNNHAYQTTSASRPILRQNAITGAYYLEFDGSDDFLRTNGIDFTVTDKVSLFAGVRKLRGTTAESILELGSSPYNSFGAFWLNSNALVLGDIWLAIAQGSTNRVGFSKLAPSGNNHVFSAKLDFAESVAEDEVKPRLNGSSAGFTRGFGTNAGTGNFGNYPLYIGRRGGTQTPFNGHIYSLIGVGRLSTDSETAVIENELANRTGVTLNV